MGRLVNECGKRHCVEPSHWRDAGVVVDGGSGTTRLAIRRAEIERLWGDGFGVVEIAKAVGCARSTVWRHLRSKR
jgi:DNA-binding CsgD family transcriptional regulator